MSSAEVRSGDVWKTLEDFKDATDYKLIGPPEKCCVRCKHQKVLEASRQTLGFATLQRGYKDTFVCSLALLEFRACLIQEYAVCNRFEVFSGSS